MGLARGQKGVEGALESLLCLQRSWGGQDSHVKLLQFTEGQEKLAEHRKLGVVSGSNLSEEFILLAPLLHRGFGSLGDEAKSSKHDLRKLGGESLLGKTVLEVPADIANRRQVAHSAAPVDIQLFVFEG